MGTKDPRFADAAPVHRVRITGFCMDATEVTNAAFARFVAATRYVTVAERPVPVGTLRNVDGARRAPGSAVFSPPSVSADATGVYSWWRWVPGADWRHPEGPTSSLAGRSDHPVVHVAYDDALAYARWIHKQLPTEAEWEYAARGGLDQQPFVWGRQERPGGRHYANTFQGEFPSGNTGADGYRATSPVKHFPPNGYGLYDMAGNVWEWTRDWYRPDAYAERAALGAVVLDPQGPTDSMDPAEAGIAKRVQRGGSFLCSDSYCARYRVAGRGRGAPDTSTNHVGFRLVMRPNAVPPPTAFQRPLH